LSLQIRSRIERYLTVSLLLVGYASDGKFNPPLYPILESHGRNGYLGDGPGLEQPRETFYSLFRLQSHSRYGRRSLAIVTPEVPSIPINTEPESTFMLSTVLSKCIHKGIRSCISHKSQATQNGRQRRHEDTKVR